MATRDLMSIEQQTDTQKIVDRTQIFILPSTMFSTKCSFAKNDFLIHTDIQG